VPEARPVERAGPPQRGRGELGLRVLSALVLAPLAIGTAYLGGVVFIAFWLIASLGVLWEWIALVRGATERSRMQRAAWIALGLLYAGTLFAAPLVIRVDAERGFLAMIYLFLVVWGTDIAAYFAGRALGGPKLCPAVSPNKTWSGALGGSAAAIVVGLIVAVAAGIGALGAIALLSLGLSIASQIGDLVESALKRRFGAKDAGHLIPGHGGLMDRLDGFLTAALAAALVGAARGGIDEAARGLLVW